LSSDLNLLKRHYTAAHAPRRNARACRLSKIDRPRLGATMLNRSRCDYELLSVVAPQGMDC